MTLWPAPPMEVLGNLASIAPGAEMGTVSHYDIQPVLDIYANVDGTDLGTVTRAMERIIDRHEKNHDLPRGVGVAAAERQDLHGIESVAVGGPITAGDPARLWAGGERAGPAGLFGNLERVSAGTVTAG